MKHHMEDGVEYEGSLEIPAGMCIYCGKERGYKSLDNCCSNRCYIRMVEMRKELLETERLYADLQDMIEFAYVPEERISKLRELIYDRFKGLDITIVEEHNIIKKCRRF